MQFLSVILTALLSIAALFLITKLMGHKQVAQLDFFDYVSGITIGSIGAELATDLEAPWQSLIALGVWGGCSMLLGLVTHKFPKTRKYVNGTPTILMDGGKLYRANLKKCKLDLSEFLLLCREQGFFDLGDVQTAIFEHNGKLSVLPKASGRPITPGDLKITAKQTHIGTEFIMDGRVLAENLFRAGKDLAWLQGALAREGYKSAAQILLGVYYGEEQRLCLYPRDVG